MGTDNRPGKTQNDLFMYAVDAELAFVAEQARGKLDEISLQLGKLDALSPVREARFRCAVDESDERPRLTYSFSVSFMDGDEYSDEDGIGNGPLFDACASLEAEVRAEGYLIFVWGGEGDYVFQRGDDGRFAVHRA